jgi:hypothetical protein
LAESARTEPFWQREPAVSSYSIYQPSTTTTADKANIISPWNELCPSIWRPKEASLDVTITWTVEDSPKRVAQELIHRCASPSLSSAKTSVMVDSLTESLETFGAFCREELTDCNNSNKFKARIVATRGPSGAKCPQWHVDHVPIRWIQSLIGPGCEFVTNPDTGIDWSVVNGLLNEEDDDEDVVYASVEDRNRALVDTKSANIYSAQEQEAILLVGNRWNEFAKTKTTTPLSLKPVVHKSPSDIPMWQGRVLLTQDVLVDE